MHRATRGGIQHAIGVDAQGRPGAADAPAGGTEPYIGTHDIGGGVEDAVEEGAGQGGEAHRRTRLDQAQAQVASGLGDPQAAVGARVQQAAAGIHQQRLAHGTERTAGAEADGGGGHRGRGPELGEVAPGVDRRRPHPGARLDQDQVIGLGEREIPGDQGARNGIQGGHRGVQGHGTAGAGQQAVAGDHPRAVRDGPAGAEAQVTGARGGDGPRQEVADGGEGHAIPVGIAARAHQPGLQGGARGDGDGPVQGLGALHHEAIGLAQDEIPGPEHARIQPRDPGIQIDRAEGGEGQQATPHPGAGAAGADPAGGVEPQGAAAAGIEGVEGDAADAGGEGDGARRDHPHLERPTGADGDRAAGHGPLQEETVALADGDPGLGAGLGIEAVDGEIELQGTTRPGHQAVGVQRAAVDPASDGSRGGEAEVPQVTRIDGVGEDVAAGAGEGDIVGVRVREGLHAPDAEMPARADADGAVAALHQVEGQVVQLVDLNRTRTGDDRELPDLGGQIQAQGGLRAEVRGDDAPAEARDGPGGVEQQADARGGLDRTQGQVAREVGQTHGIAGALAQLGQGLDPQGAARADHDLPVRDLEVGDGEVVRRREGQVARAGGDGREARDLRHQLHGAIGFDRQGRAGDQARSTEHPARGAERHGAQAPGVHLTQGEVGARRKRDAVPRGVRRRAHQGCVEGTPGLDGDGPIGGDDRDEHHPIQLGDGDIPAPAGGDVQARGGGGEVHRTTGAHLHGATRGAPAGDRAPGDQRQVAGARVHGTEGKVARGLEAHGCTQGADTRGVEVAPSVDQDAAIRRTRGGDAQAVQLVDGQVAAAADPGAQGVECRRQGDAGDRMRGQGAARDPAVTAGAQGAAGGEGDLGAGIDQPGQGEVGAGIEGQGAAAGQRAGAERAGRPDAQGATAGDPVQGEIARIREADAARQGLGPEAAEGGLEVEIRNRPAADIAHGVEHRHRGDQVGLGVEARVRVPLADAAPGAQVHPAGGGPGVQEVDQDVAPGHQADRALARAQAAHPDGARGLHVHAPIHGEIELDVPHHPAHQVVGLEHADVALQVQPGIGLTADLTTRLEAGIGGAQVDAVVGGRALAQVAASGEAHGALGAPGQDPVDQQVAAHVERDVAPGAIRQGRHVQCAEAARGGHPHATVGGAGVGEDEVVGLREHQVAGAGHPEVGTLHGTAQGESVPGQGGQERRVEHAALGLGDGPGGGLEQRRAAGAQVSDDQPARAAQTHRAAGRKGQTREVQQTCTGEAQVAIHGDAGAREGQGSGGGQTQVQQAPGTAAELVGVRCEVTAGGDLDPQARLEQGPGEVEIAPGGEADAALIAGGGQVEIGGQGAPGLQGDQVPCRDGPAAHRQVPAGDQAHLGRVAAVGAGEVGGVQGQVARGGDGDAPRGAQAAAEGEIGARGQRDDTVCAAHGEVEGGVQGAPGGEGDLLSRGQRTTREGQVPAGAEQDRLAGGEARGGQGQGLAGEEVDGPFGARDIQGQGQVQGAARVHAHQLAGVDGAGVVDIEGGAQGDGIGQVSAIAADEGTGDVEESGKERDALRRGDLDGTAGARQGDAPVRPHLDPRGEHQVGAHGDVHHPVGPGDADQHILTLDLTPGLELHQSRGGGDGANASLRPLAQDDVAGVDGLGEGGQPGDHCRIRDLQVVRGESRHPRAVCDELEGAGGKIDPE